MYFNYVWLKLLMGVLLFGVLWYLIRYITISLFMPFWAHLHGISLGEVGGLESYYYTGGAPSRGTPWPFEGPSHLSRIYQEYIYNILNIYQTCIQMYPKYIQDIQDIQVLDILDTSWIYLDFRVVSLSRASLCNEVLLYNFWKSRSAS